MRERWQYMMTQQWFQIALKTYFWAGFLFAIVFAFSVSCMVGTVYYYNQARIERAEMNRDHRSYVDDLWDSRRRLSDASAVWRDIDRRLKEMEERITHLQR